MREPVFILIHSTHYVTKAVLCNRCNGAVRISEEGLNDVGGEVKRYVKCRHYNILEMKSNDISFWNFKYYIQHFMSLLENIEVNRGDTGIVFLNIAYDFHVNVKIQELININYPVTS